MAEPEEIHIKMPLQQGVESTMLEYYDIMVIGKTGMGKSTTVDKMIIARLDGDKSGNYSAVPQSEDVNRACHKLVCSDLTMWLVSDRPSDSPQDYQDENLRNMTLRLKNLFFHSTIKDSHLEIVRAREAEESTTLQCELLSNERTKIRVLDVPGFFGREASAYAETVGIRLADAAESALSNMRKVLRIKYAHNLNFRRVVYFLPEQGALKRTSQILVAELQVMERYFGRVIFDSMVVVATMPSAVYEHAGADAILFSEKHFEQTRKHLQEALKEVFKSQDVPEPPVTFLSLLDTCEDVLRKVQSAEVLKESIDLEFRSSVCARCGLKVVEEGKNIGEPAFCAYPDHMGIIAHDESTCHPVMIPKYTRVQKVLGGILHLFTLRQFVGKWPSFTTMDEMCIECKKPPPSPGCMKIGSQYPGANKNGIVMHSSSVIERYQIEINEEAEGAEPDFVVVAGSGSSALAASQQQAQHQYPSQIEAFTFIEEPNSGTRDFDTKG